MSTNASPGTDGRADFWKGVVVGAAAVVLLVVLLMVGMMMFCPMCGRDMMHRMMRGDRTAAPTLPHSGLDIAPPGSSRFLFPRPPSELGG